MSVFPKRDEHTQSFRVFPAHCNHHYPMVFGGHMLAEMDLCAATTVSRALYDSPTGCKDALTVSVNKVTFHKGAEVGDLVFLNGRIIYYGCKSIKVHVRAYVERRTPEGITEDVMADGEFTFCGYDMSARKSMEHGFGK